MNPPTPRSASRPRADPSTTLYLSCILSAILVGDVNCQFGDRWISMANINSSIPAMSYLPNGTHIDVIKPVIIDS